MEYIKINPEEQKYAQKTLLQSQIEILTITKRYQAFKQLRRREIMLKGALRRKVSELHEELKIIDRALPRMRHQPSELQKAKTGVIGKKRSDLESEINEIKRKLERLQ